ncbi:PilW family protein [Paraburkholderia sp. PREW-6R]|uniref:PilW family protein n=1 Tax=Paraburkholderia sp. PREW-6R TaxID=3141544 RepID=UPI0031F5529C
MMKRLEVEGGHTLLEFVIAIALGLVVIAGTVLLYTAQRSAFEHAADAQRVRDAGLTALTLIGQQVQMAGFVPANVTRYNAPPALFGCSGGRPSGADESPACESLPGRSDGVVVRYVGDTVSTWPSATAQITDCLGQAVPNASAVLLEQGAPVVNRFFARTSGSTGEPELYCEGNGKTGSAQPLVEGIERLRIRYWLAGGVAAIDASAVTADQWASIVAVDLCVLVRGAMQGQRSRYVDCDSVTALGADTRVRQAFWRRVAIRNQVGDAA